MCNVPNRDEAGLSVFAKAYKLVTKGLDITVERVVKYMITSQITLSCAESCTGGLVAEAVTRVPGASAIFKGGVVSYSEEIKQQVLGVRAETLSKHTVYSAEVANEMSSGVMMLMKTDASIGITGIAGPGGGTEDKPVGTVYVSVRYKEREAVKDLRLYEEYESMDRELIRLLSAQRALEMLESLLKNESEGK